MKTSEPTVSNRELQITKTLNAPVDLVWEAWTKPEHISQWWGPDGFTNSINTMDFKPGGHWSLVMHGPDGTDYPNESIFREIVPLKKIVFDHVSEPLIRFTIEFEDRGDQTYLIWHMLFDSEEKMQEVIRKNGAADGLKQNVARFDRYLQTLK